MMWSEVILHLEVFLQLGIGYILDKIQEFSSKHFIEQVVGTLYTIFMALLCRGFGGEKVKIESFEGFTQLARGYFRLFAFGFGVPQIKLGQKWSWSVDCSGGFDICCLGLCIKNYWSLVVLLDWIDAQGKGVAISLMVVPGGINFKVVV